MLRLLNTNTFHHITHITHITNICKRVNIYHPVIKTYARCIFNYSFMHNNNSPNYKSIQKLNPCVKYKYKDDYDYCQNFDFTQFPLYNTNPNCINDVVNNSCDIPYNVRIIVNSICDTNREIYKLVDNKNTNDINKIIDTYKINTLTYKELKYVNICIYNIINEVEQEFTQINKFISNYNLFINNITNDIHKYTTYLIPISGICAYMFYLYFTWPYLHSTFILSLVCDMTNYLWVCIPIVIGLDIRELNNKRNKLKELYVKYTEKNYLIKYQYKIYMLHKIEDIFTKFEYEKRPKY